MVGARPEAIKAAPVALALTEHPRLRPVAVHSGQHVGMAEQALAPFGLRPEESLAVERNTGSQAESPAALLPALDELRTRRAPGAVLVTVVDAVRHIARAGLPARSPALIAAEADWAATGASGWKRSRQGAGNVVGRYGG